MEKIEDKAKQQKMHKDFFDRCSKAIDNGFYMEAILMEYAAIEGRLEVMLGILGLPCNKFLEDSERKKVQISHRLECLSKIYAQNDEITAKSKFSKTFFKKLEKWVGKRNEYIHGLYKNEIKYTQRIKDSQKFAEEGLVYCRKLYNEATRLRRLKKNTPNVFLESRACLSSKCNMKISVE